MPEGDSLVRLATRLRPVLAGREIVRTDVRVPRWATLDLSGARVHAVRTRAKYLLMDIGELTLLSHLSMEGRWESYPLLTAAGAPLTPRWRHPAWQARCVLETERDQVVGFQLGLLEVLPTTWVAERLGFLGPDLLDPGWARPETAEALLAEAVLRLEAAADRAIGVALLDQRLVSGIGNIYRCESLLLAGLDPHRPVSSVPDLPGLITLARDLMRANTDPPAPVSGRLAPGHPASSHPASGRPAPRRTTTDVAPDPAAPYGVRVLGAGRAGGTGRASGAGRARRVPHLWVYGRRREGCLRCGGPVTVEDLGDARGPDRVLYWCRNCQR